jgi:hypothetical protein
MYFRLGAAATSFQRRFYQAYQPIPEPSLDFAWGHSKETAAAMI